MEEVFSKDTVYWTPWKNLRFNERRLENRLDLQMKTTQARLQKTNRIIRIPINFEQKFLQWISVTYRKQTSLNSKVKVQQEPLTHLVGNKAKEQISKRR